MRMLDFNAGKYAVFVWPAYALTAAVFLVFIVDTLARAHRWRRAAQEGEAEHREATAPLDEGRPGA
jgi:heme exporter protein D